VTNWTPIIYENLAKASGSDLPAHVKVPSLPQAVLQFARKADEPDVTNSELASIVETDDGMTCALLRRVNCSTVGLRRKIASIERAIHTLGIRTCKLYLMTEAIENSMNPGASKLIDLHDFWKSNLERALFAREVAQLLKCRRRIGLYRRIAPRFSAPLVSQSGLRRVRPIHETTGRAAD